MKLYFAPMEGITDGIYRRVFHEYFGGVDKYFAPFLSPTGDFRVTRREWRQLLSDAGAPYPVIPQLLVRDGGVLATAFARLREQGFEEIDLNLGCPSGTVTAKGKGAGLLKDSGALKRLLDAAFAVPDAPRISAKTRVGFSSLDEWPGLWDILRQYPFSELVVHPRTREEYYRGRTHPELLALCGGVGFPIVFNGDVFSPADADALAESAVPIGGLMLGRGLVANPALALVLRGGEGASAGRLKAFHEALARAYADEMPFNALHGRMCEILSYMSCCFEDVKKPMKQLRKARGFDEYLERAENLFDRCALKKEPYFDPAALKT